MFCKAGSPRRCRSAWAYCSASSGQKAQKKGALFARPSGGAEAASPRAGRCLDQNDRGGKGGMSLPGIARVKGVHARLRRAMDARKRAYDPAIHLFAKKLDHPKSGLADFGYFKCESRINPTCMVKPAGVTPAAR